LQIVAKIRFFVIQASSEVRRMRFWKVCSSAGLKATSIFSFFLIAGSAVAFAQAPQNRLIEPINANAFVTVPGTANPRIASQVPTGRLSPATPIDGITMYFRPTAEQKAELDALVQAQQTPGSPEYHQWLTPAEYGSLFGLSSADLARVAGWLTSQGFNVERVGNSHTSVTFSGTAAQVENAFDTEMQQYQVDGEKHFSNATDLSVPTALGGVVLSVRNLDDFRPRPQVRYHTARAVSATPAFTDGTTGEHFLTPDDVATIYDITPAYNAGDTGSGVKIAVVGQSAINTADIENFQKAMGFTVKDPTIIQVGSSGTSTVVAGDESESDLDLEYSSGIGKGATIDFVYTGNAANYNVFDSLQWAVDNKIGQIISMSYGACEPTLSASNFTTLEGIIEQGASQGQSLIAAAGDDGSTSCYGATGISTAEQQELSVNYPASSAYATGVGGTEFPAADVAASNSTYWTQSSGSDVISSALSYIPEQVWNDDSAAIGAQYGAQYALSAGGGGASSNIKRPIWQTGVTGIASGTYRLVPDISLDSSADFAGYLYCTSDTSAWSTGQKASCNDGFRDSSTQDLTIAGGTSFATPIFAGMLSIINQKTNSSGQGVAASTLYSLASNAATYALAFHDITSGTNECTAGSTYCSPAGTSEYPATTGYDEASGLGSVDLLNLMDAWAGITTGGGGGTGTFTLAATAVTVTQGSSGTSTVTIKPSASYAGTVGFAATSSSTSLNTYGCYAISNTAVTAGTAATATLTVYTSQSTCSVSGVHSFARNGTIASTQDRAPNGGQPLGSTIPLSAAALAGVLCLGFRRSRVRMGTLMGCLMLFTTLGLAVGCGSSSGTTTTTSTDVAAGTYTVTLTGTDTTTSAITAATTFSVTVN
jgi:subtilase family serine protease